jgi:membrane-associated phospholipid phosphatase
MAMRGYLSKALNRFTTGSLNIIGASPTPTTYSSSAVWIACLISTSFTVLVTFLTGGRVAWAGFVLPMAIVAALAAVHYAIRLRNKTPELECAPGVVAAISWSGLMVLIATFAGLRANSPLIDSALARSDSLLGFSAPWLIGVISGHPSVAAMLSFLYHTAIPALIATAIILSFGGLRQRSWDLAFSFVFCSTVCGAISVIFPAEGTFIHYNIGPDIIAGLPKGAGTFYIPAFESFRSGVSTMIDFDRLTGVVTFPSFHGATALMTAFALRDIRWVAPVAWAWCILVHISTIPMGGHYGTDLVVGGLIWAISVWIAALATRRAHPAWASPQDVNAFSALDTQPARGEAE